MNYTNSIERQHLPALTVKEAAMIKNNSRQIRKLIITSHQKINESYYQFVRQYRNYHNQKRDLEYNLREDIAQVEVEQLFASMQKYVTNP